MLFINWKKTYDIPNISYETNSGFKRSRKAKFFFLSDFLFKLIHKYTFKRIIFSYMDYLFKKRITNYFLNSYNHNTINNKFNYNKTNFINSKRFNNKTFIKNNNLNNKKYCLNSIIYIQKRNYTKKNIYSKLYNYLSDIIYNLKFIFGYTDKVNILNSTFDSNRYVYNYEHISLTNKELKLLSEDIILKNISLLCEPSYVFTQHSLDSNMFLIYEYDSYYYFTNFYYVVDSEYKKYYFNGNYYSLHYIYYLDECCFSRLPNEYGVYDIWLKCDVSFGVKSSTIINLILEDLYLKDPKITLSLKKKALNSILNIKKINYNTRCKILYNKNIKISSIQKRNYVIFGSSANQIKFIKGVFTISKCNKELISDLYFKGIINKHEHNLLNESINHTLFLLKNNLNKHYSVFSTTSDTNMDRPSKANNNCLQKLKDVKDKLYEPTFGDVNHIIFGHYFCINRLETLGIYLKLIKHRTINREGLEEQFELVKDIVEPSLDSIKKEWPLEKAEYVESDVFDLLNNDSLNNQIKTNKDDKSLSDLNNEYYE